ncbi:glutathione S-transferase family protein [Pseudomonas sp. SMV7]|uniref:glutathione S-transferase family protein n=1 Tax=Pseudomonas sp. SMV7 TaxID=3390194 RepID=UPI003F86E317
MAEHALTLYYSPLSSSYHSVLIMLSLLGISCKKAEINIGDRAFQSSEYSALKSFWRGPVIDDGGVVVPSSNAILIYLGRKYGGEQWCPSDPENSAAIQRWISAAAGQLFHGAGDTGVALLRNGLDANHATHRYKGFLDLLNSELTSRHFLVKGNPTVADIALYPFVSSAPQVNIALSGYPHILSWLKNIQALPGFLNLD